MRDDKVYPVVLTKHQNARRNSMSENALATFEPATKKEAAAIHYPCLCQAIRYVTLSCRLVGILPIVENNPEKHTNSCSFRVSRIHAVVSFFIQAIYILYILITYFSRFLCGPGMTTNGLEWYVMTFGYFITDIDSLISLMAGSLQSNKTCKLLEKMSHIPGPIGEMRNLQKIMQRSVLSLFSVYLLLFSSYIYVGWLRIDYEFVDSYHCTLLDQPFGVVLRGLVVLVPTMEIGLVVMVALLICAKFKDLAETTRLTLENCNVLPQSSPVINTLDSLAENHEQIHSSLKEINKCVGLQLLMAVCSSLYTMIYYLYRYSTSSEEGMTSNTHERIHYVIGLTYRIGKLVIYMILGQNVMESSLLPLRTLQKAKILNFPLTLQQQVQSLMMQWYDKKATLSALNVINLGPWLLAPIVGNVATYLLVVLQFKTTYRQGIDYNSTSTFESIF